MKRSASRHRLLRRRLAVPSSRGSPMKLIPMQEDWSEWNLAVPSSRGSPMKPHGALGVMYLKDVVGVKMRGQNGHDSTLPMGWWQSKRAFLVELVRKSLFAP